VGEATGEVAVSQGMGVVGVAIAGVLVGIGVAPAEKGSGREVMPVAFQRDGEFFLGVRLYSSVYKLRREKKRAGIRKQ
jgi:hypothetical protein